MKLLLALLAVIALSSAAAIALMGPKYQEDINAVERIKAQKLHDDSICRPDDIPVEVRLEMEYGSEIPKYNDTLPPQ